MCSSDLHGGWRDQLIAPAQPIRLQGGLQLAAEDGVLADGALEILDRLQLPLTAAEPGHRRTIRIQQRPGGHALDPADEAPRTGSHLTATRSSGSRLGTKYHTVILAASYDLQRPRCWETDHRCLAMRPNATPSPTPVRKPSAFWCL